MPTAHRRRILVVEDSDISALPLMGFLERRGFEVDRALEFGEALAAVALSVDRQFSCIILDLGLPDIDTRLETAERIEEFAPIPVVVYTGSDEPEITRECRKHRAAICVKVMDSPLLMTHVLAAMETSEPDREIEDEILEERKAIGAAMSAVIPKKPWILEWAPAIAVTLSLLTASCIGGGFLYRMISGDAQRSERTANRFELLETSMHEFKVTAEAHGRELTELSNKAQLSLVDKDGLHRQMDLQASDLRAMQAGIDRKLETIQQAQMHLLEELNRQGPARK